VQQRERRSGPVDLANHLGVDVGATHPVSNLGELHGQREPGPAKPDDDHHHERTASRKGMIVALWPAGGPPQRTLTTCRTCGCASSGAPFLGHRPDGALVANNNRSTPETKSSMADPAVSLVAGKPQLAWLTVDMLKSGIRMGGMIVRLK
jgi:hypothetical protein